MITSDKTNSSVPENIANDKKAFSTLCLRLAPLIDVIFLLLIFFFISAQFRPEEALLPLDLPAAEAHNIAAIVEPLTVYVFSTEQGCQIEITDNAMNINSQDIQKDMTGFVENFADILKNQKRTVSDPVVLVFEDEVEWDYVAKIYNLLYGLGIKDITFRLNTEIQ